MNNLLIKNNSYSINVQWLSWRITPPVSVQPCPFSIHIPTRWWLSIPFLQVPSYCVHHVPYSHIASSPNNRHWISASLHICTPHEDARNIHGQTQSSCISAALCPDFRDISCRSFESAAPLRTDSCEQGFRALCPCL